MSWKRSGACINHHSRGKIQKKKKKKSSIQDIFFNSAWLFLIPLFSPPPPLSLTLLLFDTSRLSCGETSVCQSISLLWGEIWRASPTPADQSAVPEKVNLSRSANAVQWRVWWRGAHAAFGKASWQTAVLFLRVVIVQISGIVFYFLRGMMLMCKWADRKPQTKHSIPK